MAAGDEADRTAIVELLHHFAMAIDTRDWARYRSVFTEVIDLDYSSWNPASIGPWRADDWVAHAGKLFPGLTFTRHGLTNHLVDIDGDEARVRVNVTAEHVIVDDHQPAAVFTLNGYYDDRCVRTDDGWRIQGKRLVAQWTTGDPAVMATARARAAALLTSEH